ncbi:MAG: hypothetical protein U1E57_01475 [Paenacidovorax caeni]
MLLLALALAALVVVGGVTHIKGRWLYPLLCTVPLMAFAAARAGNGIGSGRLFGGMLLGMAVLVWLALSLRVWGNGQRGAPSELNEPVAALAQPARSRL